MTHKHETPQHTPGPLVARKGDTFNPERPWGVVKLLSKQECYEIDGDYSGFGARSVVIAEVTEGPTAEADAILFAAAPELLALAERVALEPCRELNGGHCSMLPVEPCKPCQARSAIAKAKGGDA